MARQDINIGTNANDGTGDDLRTAMQKINTNFTELYAETAVDSGITISGNTISSNRSDDDIVFEPSGVGAVRFPAVTINDNAITGTRSNENLTISAAGTGNLILGALRVNGTTVSSDDSTKITLAESVDVTGTLNVATVEINNISSADSSAIQINDDVNISGALTIHGSTKFNSVYTDKINSLTSSSTITINCALAPVHKVTLTANTGFVITSLPTGGKLTLIITQDGTGSRTATFGTDTSTSVKFPGGAPSLSTAAGSIDVVTIFNDGTNYLGTISKAFA